MKRLLDICISLFALAGLMIPMLVIAVAIRLTSSGPALHWSQRVGRNNVLFWMPKFRTMRTDAPQVATHLLTNSGAYITRLGSRLRSTSLDELPQFICVLRGQMSLVGPRPALFNQTDLISVRTAVGVHHLRPGITGWAQINGRDLLTIAEKVEYDRQYASDLSFLGDLNILSLTLIRAVRGDGYRQADSPSAPPVFNSRRAA